MSLQLIKPGTRIDFIGKWRPCLFLSLGMIAVSLVAAHPLLRGVRMGIDFAGGTEVQVRFPDTVEVGEGDVRAVMERAGIEDASVVRFGELGVNDFLIRYGKQGADSPVPESPVAVDVEETESEETQAGLEPEAEEGAAGEEQEYIEALRRALSEAVAEATVERVDFVGPRVGAELRRDGVLSLAVAGLLILIYIGIRFSVRFAPGAIVAIIHDVLITAGFWVLMGFEFDLRVLAALLAIIGYSLNDTIIVYDRIRENMELRTKQDLPEVINRSVNQTLSRTLLTSITTLLAVLSLLILGGEVIRPFAIAMAVGILVGTYSSVFVAAPTLLYLENRFGGVTPAAKGARGARA